MNYKVLYRKYRPENFDGLVGQDNISKILQNSIRNNKISHAYIFSGPRGTGKTSSAKIFAKSVNCLDNKKGNACLVCNSCKNANLSNDIIEIDAASNNGVDEIREITNNIRLSPNSLKYKVYIIDEVHMLSASAFNALLLTLEEPPSHVIFILATTNIESVPITILSRCQKFDFQKISVADIKNRLKYICKEENILIDDDALHEVAILSDGGLRDSLSLLDQLNKNEEKITIEMVSKCVNNISSQNIKSILLLIETNDVLNLIKKLEELSNQAIDYKLFLKSLINQISHTVKDVLVNNKETNFTISKYKKLMFDLTDVMNKINVNVDAFSLIEIVILDSMIVDKKTDNNEEKVKLENSKPNEEVRKNEPIKSNVLDKNIVNKTKSTRINNCFAEATKEEKIKKLEIWEEYKLDAPIKIKGIILDTELVAASNSIMIVIANIKNNVDELYINEKLITNSISKICGKIIKLVFITKVDWEKLSQEYINNIKNGVKYIYEEEVVDEKENLEAIVGEIFSSDKVKEG